MKAVLPWVSHIDTCPQTGQLALPFKGYGWFCVRACMYTPVGEPVSNVHVGVVFLMLLPSTQFSHLP